MGLSDDAVRGVVRPPQEKALTFVQNGDPIDAIEREMHPIWTLAGTAPTIHDSDLVLPEWIARIALADPRYAPHVRRNGEPAADRDEDT